ncbi:capsid protein [Sewage-associated circular DNA virus-37]|uniref:capsid protein n=1 Tax=Sewage-associated circular DNA virus-37 TaxID=1592104 RepID=UPI000585DA2A|nr:capsid protein [Sewage-associated circular DNA virus-37]AJD07520.1 capsid protein [Sewage-associated circular DNA virus-37]
MPHRNWRKRTHDALHRVGSHVLRNGKTYGDVYSAYKKLKTHHSSERSIPMAPKDALTNQFNAQTIFRRKKNRRWRKQLSFAQKVLRANQIFSSEKTYQLMRTWASAAAAGVQGFNGISLYANGSGDADVNDIFQAYDNVTSREWSINMKSAHVDYLCTNVGSTTLVLKVYTIVPKKDAPVAAGNNLGNAWIASLDMSVAMPGSTVGLDQIVANPVGTPARPGATPFDSSVFCSQYTVIKCVEYILPPGQVASFNDSMMRRGKLDTAEFNVGVATTKTNWAVKGWTKSHLFVHHGIATSGAVSSLATYYPASSLGVIANKTYKFTVNEQRNQSEIQVASTVT